MEVRSCVVHLGRKGWKSLGYRTERETISFEASFFLADGWHRGSRGSAPPEWMSAGPTVGCQVSAVPNTSPGAAKGHLLSPSEPSSAQWPPSGQRARVGEHGSGGGWEIGGFSQLPRLWRLVVFSLLFLIGG